MDSAQAEETFSGLNVTGDPTNPKAEDSAESDLKNFTKPKYDSKLSLRIVKPDRPEETDECCIKTKEAENSEELDLENEVLSPNNIKFPLNRNKADHPPTSVMVLDPISTHNMGKGALVEAFSMDKHYEVDEISPNGQFKIKMEDVKQNEQNSKLDEKRGKSKSGITEKIGLKIDTEGFNDINKLALKKKKPKHPPTSKMVIESIKALKMRDGASLKAITDYMDFHFEVNMKSIKPFLHRFLISGGNGTLELVRVDGKPLRFKIKKQARLRRRKRKRT